jgi:hypothetical protein
MDVAVVCAYVENQRLLDFRIARAARPFALAQMECASAKPTGSSSTAPRSASRSESRAE